MHTQRNIPKVERQGWYLHLLGGSGVFKCLEMGWTLFFFQNGKPTESLFWRRRIKKTGHLKCLSESKCLPILIYLKPLFPDCLLARDMAPMTAQLNAHCFTLCLSCLARAQAEPPDSRLSGASSKLQDHPLKEWKPPPPYTFLGTCDLGVLASYLWSLQKHWSILNRQPGSLPTKKNVLHTFLDGRKTNRSAGGICLAPYFVAIVFNGWLVSSLEPFYSIFLPNECIKK